MPINAQWWQTVELQMAAAMKLRRCQMNHLHYPKGFPLYQRACLQLRPMISPYVFIIFLCDLLMTLVDKLCFQIMHCHIFRCRRSHHRRPLTADSMCWVDGDWLSLRMRLGHLLSYNQPRQTNGGDAKSCDHSRHVMWEPVWRHAEVALFFLSVFYHFFKAQSLRPKVSKSSLFYNTWCYTISVFSFKRLGYLGYDMISVWLMRDIRFESTPQANQLSGTFRENDKFGSIFLEMIVFETSINTCSSLA